MTSNSGSYPERREVLVKLLTDYARHSDNGQEIPVKDLRKVLSPAISWLFKLKEDKYQKKLKGMWVKPPAEWPQGVPFRDPNNKNAGERPKKEVLRQMFKHGILPKFQEWQRHQSQLMTQIPPVSPGMPATPTNPPTQVSEADIDPTMDTLQRVKQKIKKIVAMFNNPCNEELTLTSAYNVLCGVYNDQQWSNAYMIDLHVYEAELDIIIKKSDLSDTCMQTCQRLLKSYDVDCTGTQEVGATCADTSGFSVIPESFSFLSGPAAVTLATENELEVSGGQLNIMLIDGSHDTSTAPVKNDPRQSSEIMSTFSAASHDKFHNNGIKLEPEPEPEVVLDSEVVNKLSLMFPEDKPLCLDGTEHDPLRVDGKSINSLVFDDLDSAKLQYLGVQMQPVPSSHSLLTQPSNSKIYDSGPSPETVLNHKQYHTLNTESDIFAGLINKPAPANTDIYTTVGSLAIPTTVEEMFQGD